MAARGEAEFQFNKKVWVLRYDFAAQALFERLAGGGVRMGDLLTSWSRTVESENPSLPIGFNELACLFAAGLKRFHPKFASRAEAEKLIESIIEDADTPAEGLSFVVQSCMEGLMSFYNAGKAAPDEKEESASGED